MPIRKHRCPARGCTIDIPDTHLSCLTHWQALPMFIRKAVYDTERLPLLDPRRRAALEAALNEWKEQQTR